MSYENTPYETLLLTADGPVATITLNRPKVLNALNRQVFDDLEVVFQGLAADFNIRVILLTGSGEKAFAAGADITELVHSDSTTGERSALRGQAIMRLMETCGKPVIAAINGFALGGGCELAMACTYRLAADSARLGQPEIKLGLIPGYGGTQRLPRLIGPSATLRLLLTGDMVTAEEALRLGLVDQVVPAAALLETANALARKIAPLAPLAIAASIEAVRGGSHMPLDEALAFEARLFGHLCDTDDKREGTNAFLEKRPPVFTGR